MKYWAQVVQLAVLVVGVSFSTPFTRACDARPADVCVLLAAGARGAWLRLAACIEQRFRGHHAAVRCRVRLAGLRGTVPRMSLRGGIDLGGTKIQAVVVDEDHEVLGDARAPTPTEGGPQDVVDGDGAAPARGRRRRRRRAADLPGRRRLARRDRRGRRARSRARATCPAGRAASRWPTSCGARSARRWRSATTSTSPPTPSSSSARRASSRSLLGVFWGTGVGGGIVLDGKPWTGRGAAGEIGHVVVEMRRRAVPVRAARLHGGLRRPRGDGGCARASCADEGRKTVLFEIMEERGRAAAHQRRLGARAGARRRPRPRADRPRRPARSAPASPRP